MEVIKIKYLNDNCKIEKLEVGDWLDLKSAVTLDLKAGEYYEIPLGFACALPVNYEAYVVPRSSSFKKFGFIQVNSPAIIDNSFAGDTDEWKLLVYAVKDGHIDEGNRICQMRIQAQQPPIIFLERDTLGNPSRGGIGSSGV